MLFICTWQGYCSAFTSRESVGHSLSATFRAPARGLEISGIRDSVQVIMSTGMRRGRSPCAGGPAWLKQSMDAARVRHVRGSHLVLVDVEGSKMRRGIATQITAVTTTTIMVPQPLSIIRTLHFYYYLIQGYIKYQQPARLRGGSLRLGTKQCPGPGLLAASGDTIAS